MDRFRQAVGGVAFAALLTFGIMVAGVWAERDAGLSSRHFEAVR